MYEEARAEQAPKKRMPVEGWPEKNIAVGTCANGYTLSIRDKEGNQGEYLYFNTTALIIGIITHLEDEVLQPCDVEKIIEDHRNIVAPLNQKLSHISAQYEQVQKRSNEKALRIRELEKQIKEREKELADQMKVIEKMKEKMKR